MKAAAAGLAGLVLVGAAGCCQHAAPARPAYFGSTEPLAAVVQRVNANNQQIVSLWSRADFDGVIVDEKKAAHSFSARGVLLYRAPHELLIRANDDFGNLLFEIGATAETFWLKSAPQDTMWWGDIASASELTGADIPIRPDLVLDVLAVAEIPANFAAEPFPVMRFDNADDAYIVDSIRRSGDQNTLEKEVWYDRATLSPRRVILFDPNGRETLRAELSGPQAIADSSATVATHFELAFPGSGSTLKFTLSDQRLSKNGIPHEGSIRPPDPANSGMKNVIRVGARPLAAPPE